jgi:hypothetical protein
MKHTNRNPAKAAATFAGVLKQHDDMVKEAGGATGPHMGTITAADPQASLGYVDLKTRTATGTVCSFFWRGEPHFIDEETGEAFTGMTEAETWFQPDQSA